MEIKEIRNFHDNKIYIDENGNKSTYKELTNNKFKDEMVMINNLYEIFKTNPMSLELYDFELLRKHNE